MSLCNQFPALLWATRTVPFDGRCYFYSTRDCPGWQYGSVCARLQREIPMTEDTGWPPADPPEDQAATPEPAEDQSATPVPDEDADPQQVAEQAAAAEPLAGNDDTPATPDPDWLIDMRTQHPGSALLAAIEYLYQHLGG